MNKTREMGKLRQDGNREEENVPGKLLFFELVKGVNEDVL